MTDADLVSTSSTVGDDQQHSAVSISQSQPLGKKMTKALKSLLMDLCIAKCHYASSLIEYRKSLDEAEWQVTFSILLWCFS